jgi:hypothetical protein
MKNHGSGHDSKHGHHEMYQKMMQISGAKGGYHRDQIFHEENCSEFLWCLHCRRTYRRGEYRDVDGFQMCPYEGCDGSTVLDGIDWDRFREDYPEYPEVPERGEVYEMS